MTNEELSKWLHAVHESSPQVVDAVYASKQRPRALERPNTIACHERMEAIYCFQTAAPINFSFINKRIQMQMYNALFIPALCPHQRLITTYDNYDEEISIHLDIHLPTLQITQPILLHDHDNVLGNLFQMILKEKKFPREHAYLLEYYTKTLLTTALYMEHDLEAADSFSMDSIMQYINSHYKEAISLDALSSIFHISKSYLCHRFKAEHGETIITYINQLRLNHAKRMLLGTKKNIDEIAYEAGFNSVKYFNQVFKSQEKMTPTQFRQSLTREYEK